MISESVIRIGVIIVFSVFGFRLIITGGLFSRQAGLGVLMLAAAFFVFGYYYVQGFLQGVITPLITLAVVVFGISIIVRGLFK
ncbi:MAG: hypothetical protein P9L99_11130 [Candidatus Lernaella stagnicola]|nr:hypothetical protein [Candidatus Lernaella stagnicola]